MRTVLYAQIGARCSEKVQKVVPPNSKGADDEVLLYVVMAEKDVDEATLAGVETLTGAKVGAEILSEQPLAASIANIKWKGHFNDALFET